MTNESIILLNGCFWGSEYCLRDIPVETVVGYAGGISTIPPTYYNLDSSGHSEAVKVSFDASKVSIVDILSITVIKSLNDPSPPDNPRYRRAVLCENEEQVKIVEQFKYENNYDFSVEISNVFYKAEDYHQKYYERSFGDD